MKNLTSCVLGFLCAVVSAGICSAQKADVQVLVQQIRKAMEAQAAEWSFDKGGESGPAASGDFFLGWTRGEDRLTVRCSQYDSPEAAVHEVRQLRRSVSAGVPAPLPGIADEAYYLGPYGRRRTWHVYFARRWFVCQVGGGPEGTTRQLTEIVVKELDAVRTTGR